MILGGSAAPAPPKSLVSVGFVVANLSLLCNLANLSSPAVGVSEAGEVR